jgi:hypothetical protein
MAMSVSTELYVSGGYSRQTYAHSEQPDSLYDALREIFPWVKKENYFSISTPTYHELMEENVTTCCLPRALSSVLFGERVVLAARKFCMTSAKSYSRAYYMYDGDVPDWLPDGCTLMFYTENVEEYGRPFPSKVLGFADYYFTGDPAAVEEHFDLPERRGAYTTLYGVTKEGDTVKRVKQYCYDDEESTFVGWIAAYNLFKD